MSRTGPDTDRNVDCRADSLAKNLWTMIIVRIVSLASSTARKISLESRSSHMAP